MASHPTPLAGPALLGNGYDASDVETAQELCTAQRNILLAALRYDTGQRRDAENSLLLALQVKLLTTDEAIVEQLVGTPAHRQYLAADRKAQRGLLFSNAFLKEDGHPSLRQVLAEQAAAVAAHPHAHAAFTQKLVVLEKLHALQGPGLPDDDEGQPRIARDLRPWLRYYAWRKVQYLNRLEQHWLVNDFVADETRLLTQLHEGSDLALLQLGQFAPKPRLQARPPAPAASPDLAQPLLAGAGSSYDNFALAKAELADIAGQLKKAAAGISGTSLQDAAKLKSYEQEYATLTQKQAAYTYLLAQKKASLSTSSQAVEKAKDWLAANRANTSAVVMATGKALWAGAGLSLAQALKDSYNGKAVDPELGKKVLTGVAIAAGTALATYLLGPIGPMMSGMALGYFYPQPDPVMDRLKSIEGKVDLGFQRTEQHLNQLTEQIKKGFSAVEAKLRQMTEELLDKSDLMLELHRFKEALEQGEELLTQLEQPYNRLFEVDMKERTALTDELLKQHAAFGAKLDALVRRFYRRDYQLDLGRLDGTGAPGRPALPPSLSQLVIDFYQRQDPACFQPFHVACRDLSALADILRLLVLRYFDVRPKVQAVLAAAAVFMVEDHKELLLRRLLDMQRREADERAAYFAGVLQLDRLVLGESNHTLYMNLTSYLLADDPRAEFNLLKGFGLLPDADPGQHYEPNYGPDNQPATWLRAAPRPAAPARYYLAPVGRSKTDLTYQLFSFWRHATLPARLHLHLALARHDHVLLSPVGFGGETLRAQAVGCESPAFAGSFEQWVLTGNPLTEDDLCDAWLRKSLPQRHREVGLALYTNTNYSRTLVWPTVKLLTPNSEVRVPTHGHPQPTQWRAVQPLLRPDAVGLRVDEYEATSDPRWYDLSGLAGIWPTQQALGNYRPVVADEKKPGYRRDFGEEWSRRLPFRHVLYPGDRLQSLRSPNGHYWLQLDYWPNAEVPVLYLYDNGQRQGSVFNKYDYRSTIGQLRIEMQTDGNLVLYDDDAGHAVAATHTHDLPNSLLHLNNEGQLHLCAPDGALRRTLALHTLKLKQNNRTSYWQTGSRIDQNQELLSPNGQYRVQLQFCRRADAQERYSDYSMSHTVGSPGSLETVWRVGFRLARYRRTPNQQPAVGFVAHLISLAQQQEAGEYAHVISLIPPVSHSSEQYRSAYYWDKCSDDLIDYIDTHVSESKEMKVRLDFRAGGEVVGSIVSRQLIIAKSYYGTKQVQQLLAASNASQAGVFLALENDGSLRFRSYDTDEVLATLLAPV